MNKNSRSKIQYKRRIKRGIERSLQYSDQSLEAKEFKQVFKIELPFLSHLLKNQYKKFSKNHVFISKESRDAGNLVSLKIKSELNKQKIKFFHNKISIALHIQKPSTASDAINFLDSFADIIKKVLKIDDKWFEIHALTWAVVKTEPKIILYICQDVAHSFDAVICKFCGNPFPVSSLSKIKQKQFEEGKLRKRICIKCRSLKTELGNS